MPGQVFVRARLPGATEPVVAGRIQLLDGRRRFSYGRANLANPQTISLHGPELPLRSGRQEPPDGLDMAGCL